MFFPLYICSIKNSYNSEVAIQANRKIMRAFVNYRHLAELQSSNKNPLPYCLLPFAFCLLPFAFCLLPSAFCLLPFAFCLLPSAFCLLPFAFCLLPFA